MLASQEEEEEEYIPIILPTKLRLVALI